MRRSSVASVVEAAAPLAPESDGDRYLAASGRLLAALASADGAASLQVEGAVAVVSGVGSNSENGVVGPLREAPGREAGIARLIGFIHRRNVPGSWLLLRPPDAGDGLAEALVAAGCRPEQDGAVMGGPVSVLDLAVPDGVQITPVTTAAGLEHWLCVAATCGWIETPEELARRRRVYGSLPSTGTLRRWTATQDGTPVGMAAALLAGDTLYLTDSAVIPEVRRRGIGRALAATRLRLGAEGGCTRAVLAPTPDGAALWHSLGFVESRQPRQRWFFLPDARRARLEVAPARAEEIEPILALHREAGWPGTHVEGAVWAAREGGILVGSLQLVELAPALLLIDAVVVRAGARGRGIGAELVRTVLGARAGHWWLECRPERVAFYQRLGFALVEEAEVPALVRARVGCNRVRPQRFLSHATCSTGEDRSAPG